MLGRKLGLQAASLARISVCDFKKHCLVPLFKLRRCSRFIAHRLFFVNAGRAKLLGSANPARGLRRYYVAREFEAADKDTNVHAPWDQIRAEPSVFFLFASAFVVARNRG